MVGPTVENLVGAGLIENAAYQSSVALVQTLINRSMGGFSNSILYMLMLESINGLMTGWYD
jgi:hypothetical protein